MLTDRPRTQIYYVLLSIFSVGYGYLLLSQPALEAQSRFLLSVNQVQGLRLSVVLLNTAIWFCALHAALAFYRFAHRVREAPREKGYAFIAVGLLILLINLILGAAITALGNYLETLTSIEMTQRLFRLIVVYLPLMLYAAAFAHMYAGSRHLLTANRASLPSGHRRLGVTLVVAGIGLLYSTLILLNPYRSVSMDPSIRSTYHVSDVWIFITIVLPYVVIWWLGIKSVVNIAVFRCRVQGIIYRRLLRFFDAGVSVVVFSIIALEILRQFTVFFSAASLGWILLIIYVLLAFILAGYFLIAKSGRQLDKIENT